MKRHTPPLNALRAFEATARLLSFQHAARELNVTHSAVSHQIKKLESDLEIPLFLRHGRSVELTDIGRLYYGEIHQAFRRIEQSTIELFGEPNKGELTVHTYIGIISLWLIQRLSRFRQQFQNIQVELYNNYLGWDFEKDKADIGVIYSEQPTDDLIYHPLFRGSLVPVCSPQFLAENPCRSLNDLCRLPFLNVMESPPNLSLWAKHHGVRQDRLKIVNELDNCVLAVESSANHMGVAVVPIYFASAYLAANKLVVPIEYTAPERGCWYLVQEAEFLNNSRATCFGHWLRQELREDEILQRYCIEFFHA